MADNAKSERPSIRPSLRASSLKTQALAAMLDQPLEDEERILDALVSALSAGEDTEPSFQKLHRAAERDDRIVNLAFAYERLPNDPRVRMLPKVKQTELFMQAATFFVEVFGDADGAVTYAEKAFQAVPEDSTAFSKLEKLLASLGDHGRLAKACSTAAAHRKDANEKLALLRRAAGLLQNTDDGGRDVIAIHQQILALDPADRDSREQLTELYLSTRRYRDLAKLLEEVLVARSGPDADETRLRLVALYRGELRDPPRAAPHVEELLSRQPVDPAAIQAAEALLDHRALVPVLAPRLSDVYRRQNRLEDEATVLALELRTAKPPRSAEVHRRLAVLRQDVLGDPAGALELLEPLVSRDPADEDLRRRYLDVSNTFHKQLDAARLLSRALASVKDPRARARISLEIGEAYARAGEGKRAQEALQQVLDQEADPGIQLVAARQIVELSSQSEHSRALPAALEHLVLHEPDLASRISAAKRLADIADDGERPDPRRAIIAYRALLHSPRVEEALAKLESLYLATGDEAGVAETLDQRAARASDPAEARAFAFRAAELRSTNAEDKTLAAEAWQRFVDAYGPSRDAHARLIPLLEQSRRYADLAAALFREVELATEPEKPRLLSRLGQVRLAHLDDASSALRSFSQALKLDPREKTSRRAVEKLLAEGSYRIAAADVLEPVYRKENDHLGLVQVWIARAEALSDPNARFAAYGEAVSIVETHLSDARIGLDICAKALRLAAELRPALILAWHERFVELGSRSGDQSRRAGGLADALDGVAIDSPERAFLAKQAAEALARLGDVSRALEMYRRVLAYEPSSVDLLSRIDELLADSGNAADRLQLYRAALAQPSEPARRWDLMHAIAHILERDLQDLPGAIETWRALIAERPDDLTAHEALVAAFREIGDAESLLAELDRGLEYQKGPARLRAQLLRAELLAERGSEPEALEIYAAILPEADVDDGTLAIIERLAESAGRYETLRLALERRAQGAAGTAEQAGALERLGDVLAEHFEDLEAAVESWKAAAKLSSRIAGDTERTRRLFERVLDALPEDKEAAEILILAHAEAGNFAEIQAPFSVLLRGDAGAAASRLLELEAQAVAAGKVDEFAAMADEVLGLQSGESTRRARDLMAAKARVLVVRPERHDEAASVFRGVIEAYGRPEDVDTFARFIAEHSEEPARVHDRRWLYAWRAEHSADPVSALLEWAAFEEERGDEPERAVIAYERVLEIQADHPRALTALSRLRFAAGDYEGVLRLLGELRNRPDPEDPVVLDVRRAMLLIERLERPEEALALLRSALELAPADPEVLGVATRLLGIAETRNEAAEMLESVAMRSDSPAVSTTVLKTLVDATEDAENLATERARWYADLIEASETGPETLSLAVRAATKMPSVESLWDAAERLARRIEDPDAVAAAYRTALEGSLAPDVAERIGRRLVEFHEEWFDSPDTVLALLRRVLELSPRARWALDRVKLALNAEGRWHDLFELYDKAIAGTDAAAEREDLLDEAALAAKDLANDPRRAIEYLERLFDLRPADARIEASLERLYDRQGESEKLLRLLERREHGAEGDEQVSLLCRLAGLSLDLGDVPTAFSRIERLLVVDRDHAATYALLERVVDTASAPVEKKKRRRGKRSKPTHAERAIALLKDYYDRNGKKPEYARVLQKEIALGPSGKDQIKRLDALLSYRLEELDDAIGAFENAASLVQLEPQSSSRRGVLAELASRIDAQERRAEILTSVAETDKASSARLDLLLEAAQVYRGELERPERAIELLTRVFELSPPRSKEALRAGGELDSLLEQVGRTEERVDVLEKLAAAEQDSDRKRRALAEAARLAAAELGDDERAQRAWGACLELDPSDIEALDGLDAAYERMGRWTDLVSVLERRAGLGSPAASRTDGIRVARLYEERIGDRDAAIRCWRSLTSNFGSDEESFAALSSLLEADGRWSELAELVETVAAAAAGAERADLYRRLGDLHRDRTGRPEDALDAYLRAADFDRAEELVVCLEDRETSKRVGSRLLDAAIRAWSASGNALDSRAAEATRRTLQTLIQRHAEDSESDRVLELQLLGAELPFERSEQRRLLRDAAWTACDRLESIDRAIELLERLFGEDASDDVATSSVTRYARLLEESARYADLCALWEGQAECRAAVGDRAGAAALWARSATIWEERLHDVERAIAVHRQGAALGGEASLEALARLYLDQRNHRAATVALEWLSAQSPREVLGARSLALSEAYVRLGERARARERLERAAAIALDSAGVRERLAELYRQDALWTPLATLLEEDAARAPDKRTRLARLREAAALHLERRGEPAMAVPLLEQAAELAPDEPALGISLSEALSAAGRYEDAVEILRTQVEQYGNRKPKGRAVVHFHLAKVALAAGRRAEALAELDVASRINPAHPAILHELGRLALAEDQLSRAERTYRALLLVLRRPEDAESAGPGRSEVYLDLSEVAERQGDTQRAADFIESAFEVAIDSEIEAEALERALRSKDRPELLARALSNRVEHGRDPAVQARALADLVQLSADGSEAGESTNFFATQAARLFDALEALPSADPSAWTALSRVYQWLGDADFEARALEKRVEALLHAAVGEDDVESLYRLAEIRLRDSSRRDEGVLLLRRAIEVRPDFDRAERLLIDAAAADGERSSVIELLEEVARLSGHEETLVTALSLGAAAGVSNAAKVREGVELGRGLGRLDDVVRLLRGALRSLDSSGSPDLAAWMREQLAEILLERGEVTEARDLLEEAAELAEPDGRRSLRLRAASLSVDRLEDLGRAATLYARVLEDDAADRDAWEPLLDVYRKQERQEDLVLLIERTVPLVESNADKGRLRLEEAGVLLTQPGRRDAARELLERVVDEHPALAEATELLGELLAEDGRLDELAALLERRLDVAKTNGDAVLIERLSLRLGAVLEKSERGGDALEVYSALLGWVADSRSALRSIVRLTEALERPAEDLALALERLLGVEEPEAIAEVARRLIALRKQQGDAAGVERALEAAVRAAPVDASLRTELIELYAQRGEQTKIAEVLKAALAFRPSDRLLLVDTARAFESIGRLEEAIGVLTEELERAPEDVALFAERARLYRAADRYAEAIADLEAAHRTGGGHLRELAQLLESAIARSEVEESAAYAIMLADVLEKLGSTAQARQHLAELLKSQPKHREALRRLAWLASSEGRWEEASAAYRRLIPLEEGEDLIAAAMNLADACERGDRLADARGGLERALALEPANPELRQRLRGVYEATGAHRELAGLYLDEAAGEPKVMARAELLLRAAELLIDRNEDADEAIRVLGEVKALSPESVPAALLLSRAHTALGRSEDALAALNDVVSVHRGRRMRELSDVFREISNVHLELGDLSAALEALVKAFELDMRDGELAMQLGHLAMDLDDDAVAARAFRAVTMMKVRQPGSSEGASPESKAVAYYHLGRLARASGDVRKARLMASKAVSENPLHEDAQALLEELRAG